MARSPKVTKTTTKEVKPLKPILKETTSTAPSTSMAIVSKPKRESPPGGGPKRPPGGEPKQRKQAPPPGGEPKQKKQPSLLPGGGDDIDESIYYNLFEETVQKELPKVDGNTDGAGEYSVEYLQDELHTLLFELDEVIGVASNCTSFHEH